MNKSKVLTFIFLFTMLTLVHSVSAVKPTQIIDSGCEVRSPTAEFIKVGNTLESNLHVLNLTVGANNNLVNGTSMCFIHLFNSTGHHIFKENYSWDGEDWEFDILGGNLSNIGEYPFYIQCASSESICAVSGKVTATLSGNPLATGNLLVIMILLCFIIFVGTVYVLYKGFEKGVMMEIDLNDLVKSFTAFFVFLLFYWFAWNYWGDPFIMSLLEASLYVVGFLSMFVTSGMLIFSMLKKWGDSA